MHVGVKGKEGHGEFAKREFEGITVTRERMISSLRREIGVRRGRQERESGIFKKKLFRRSR